MNNQYSFKVKLSCDKDATTEWISFLIFGYEDQQIWEKGPPCEGSFLKYNVI